MRKKRLAVGITGASGAPVAVELLRQLRRLPDVESHVVCSRGGELTIGHECPETLEQVKALADVWYDNRDIGAALASGSFRTIGMAVVPCSMKSIAGIVSGFSDSLLLRAADVTLKERRRLVLMPREAPLSTLHLRNLTTASELGAMILPPVPSWYRRPATIADVNSQLAARLLSLFDLDDEVPEWTGLDA